MIRTVKTVTELYKEKSLDLVERVFSDFYNSQEGSAVKGVVKEIRSKKYYIPELELMAVDENGNIIGYAMFSRFHIEGRYENELLILTPVAVKTELQRQHISKDIIEYGLKKSKEMGYTAVLVEGNPDNYNSRGFVTAADYGIFPGKTVHLPKIECLMICELVPGTLERMYGTVDYSFYRSLCGEIVE
ncbi:MAG: N-acetyltransferase [bacterium]|nr:N-acetyltransferase [bacterium]